MKLKGKAALVTGGGTGMGRAITLKLAGEGADVAINYSRRAKEAEETVEAVRRLGVRAFAMKADVAVEAEAVRLVDEAAKQFGRLDVLVNNAGWSTAVPHRQLDGLTEEVLERTWQINVKGPIYVTRAAIPHLVKAGGGAIVNTTSVAGLPGGGQLDHLRGIQGGAGGDHQIPGPRFRQGQHPRQRHRARLRGHGLRELARRREGEGHRGESHGPNSDPRGCRQCRPLSGL